MTGHLRSTSPRAPLQLLAGPSPVNMVHGAIELDGGANGAPRPSQAAIDAARNEILAALWGVEL